MNTYENNSYQDIEETLIAVIDHTSKFFTNEQYRELVRYADQHGEYGIAFDGLCYVLKGQELDEYSRRKIRYLGEKMQIDKSVWVHLCDSTKRDL